MVDEPKYPEVRPFSITVASSVGTATLTYGAQIWKTAELPSRPPPEHPVYSLIGQVASSWSHIDHLLDILIWQLADVDAQAGACITAQIAGTYGRFKTVIALLTFHQQRTNKNLKPLIDMATELSNKANGPGERASRCSRSLVCVPHPRPTKPRSSGQCRKKTSDTESTRSICRKSKLP